MKIGDFVKVKSDEETWNKHVGIIVDIVENTARVLWLTEDCHFTLHWSMNSLEMTTVPETVDWENVSDKVGYYVQNYFYLLEHFPAT